MRVSDNEMKEVANRSEFASSLVSKASMLAVRAAKNQDANGIYIVYESKDNIKWCIRYLVVYRYGTTKELDYVGI